MWDKAMLSLLIAALVATVVTASPLLSSRPNGPLTITLRERSGLTRADGVFDYEKAVRSVEVTRNKHRQNMINFRHNRVSPVVHRPEFEPPTSGCTNSSRTNLSQRQVGTEPLTDENQDTEWVGPVTIGAPPQRFNIDFDTGSADLWVPSSTCLSSICKPKHRYDASKSTTSKPQSGTFGIQYGDGSSVKGSIYTDTVDVAGVRAFGQILSAAYNLSSLFAGDPADGILGLAFPPISQLGRTPFFQTAVAQMGIDPFFAFYLASRGSQLHLGGFNRAFYSGSIEYHPVSSNGGFWQIGNAQISVNGNLIAVNQFQTIIDSGTTIMYGPPDDVAKVYSQVAGSKLFDEQNGFYEFPCKNVPNVAFNWGGNDWVISAGNFNLGQTTSGSSMCIGALGAMDLGLGKGVWLLGDR